jgi:hypothetical protein
MLMLYNYALTMFDDQLKQSYWSSMTIVADTEDDRMKLLRQPVYELLDGHLTRQVLVSARALTLRELSVLDEAMRSGPDRQWLDLVHPLQSCDYYCDLVDSPRLLSKEEVASMSSEECRRNVRWKTIPRQYENCSRYRTGSRG